jgi:hypothetical protein
MSDDELELPYMRGWISGASGGQANEGESPEYQQGFRDGAEALRRISETESAEYCEGWKDFVLGPAGRAYALGAAEGRSALAAAIQRALELLARQRL